MLKKKLLKQKKIRKAVNRVLLRRRVREAYRLNKKSFVSYFKEKDISLKIAFIYLSDEINDYATIESKVQALMKKIIDNTEKNITNKDKNL